MNAHPLSSTDQSSPRTARRAIPRLAEPLIKGSMAAFVGDRLKFLRHVARECGDIGTFRLWNIRLVLLNNTDYVQTVLVERADDFDKRRQLPLVRATSGDGLFSALSRTGAHRRQRKLLQPAFQPRRIAAYADTMVEVARQVEGSWQDGQTIQTEREMERITLGIAGKTLFNVDMLGEAHELGAAITALFALFGEELKAPIPLPLWIPTPHARRVKEAVARLDATVKRIIRERRTAGGDKGDFLSMLFEARFEDGTPLTDQQVRDEAITMLLAGHETTALALTWTWYLLATHPDVYRRVQQEIDQILEGRDPTPDDLNFLPYTLQVWKEAMRLYPPADLISARVALRDVELDGYFIRRGTIILISPSVLHHNARYFENPEVFDPERFTPEKEKLLPRHAYMPFGGGPRICIGSHFASMEGRLVLAALLQRVRFELVPGQDVQPQAVFTTRPRHDIQMTVRRR